MKRLILKIVPVFISIFFVLQPVNSLWAKSPETLPFHDAESIELPDENLLSEIDFDESLTEDEGFLPESLNPVWYLKTELNTIREEHPLNPKGSLFEFTEQKSSTFIDLDWTPQLTDSISFRSRAALLYQVEDGEYSFHRYYLEGYLQWQNESKTAVVDAGKVKTEWGSGYAWNPSQVLLPLKEDVSNDIEENEGIEMIKLEVVWNKVTSTAVIARLESEDVTVDISYQVAFKASIEFEPWEISLIHHQATQLGWTNALSFTGLMTDTLEFHGEYSRSEFRDRLTPRKEADGIQMGSSYLPARYDYIKVDRDRKYEKFLIGGQYTFGDDKNLVFELYKTSHGYTDKEWQLVKKGVKEALAEDAWQNPNYPYTTSVGNPYSGFLKSTMKAISNEELRQHYFFLRYTSGKTDNNWEWEQLMTVNLDDKSQIHQATLHKTCMDQVKSSLSVTLFRGDDYSEFGLNPYRETASFEIEIRF